MKYSLKLGILKRHCRVAFLNDLVTVHKAGVADIVESHKPKPSNNSDCFSSRKSTRLAGFNDLQCTSRSFSRILPPRLDLLGLFSVISRLNQLLLMLLVMQLLKVALSLVLSLLLPLYELLFLLLDPLDDAFLGRLSWFLLLQLFEGSWIAFSCLVTDYWNGMSRLVHAVGAVSQHCRFLQIRLGL